MELIEFVDLKRPRWASLERLLDQAERDGLKKLSLEDARALSRLYRSASSDLLWVRARSGSADVSGYLNDLVGRAYALTYPGKRVRLRDAARFVAFGFPDLLLKEWRVFVASLLICFGGFGFGWAGMTFDPDAAPYLVPSQHQSLDPVQRQKEEAQSPGHTGDEQVAFASFLFTHNIEVAHFAYALGITAGVGTAILVFFNGVLLGALGWVYQSKAMAGWFWAWILPHGIPELTAICLAGAAGFVMARGLIAPRGLPRRVALRREARTAVQLLLGTEALFVLAGCIEGTISQVHPPRLSVEFKIAFATLVGGGVYAYLLSALAREPGLAPKLALGSIPLVMQALSPVLAVRLTFALAALVAAAAALIIERRQPMAPLGLAAAWAALISAVGLIVYAGATSPRAALEGAAIVALLGLVRLLSAVVRGQRQSGLNGAEAAPSVQR